MHIRKLKREDATFMLEWMHDIEVVKEMKTDFSAMTIDMCENFIDKAKKCENDLHLAIVDDDNNYMGTVSLKEINRKDKSAEFAIVIRKCGMGRGYSSYAMKKILEIAFEELKLETVYWCVSVFNQRAVKFYNKMGYKKVDKIPETLSKRYKEDANLIWYSAQSTVKES